MNFQRPSYLNLLLLFLVSACSGFLNEQASNLSSSGPSVATFAPALVNKETQESIEVYGSCDSSVWGTATLEGSFAESPLTVACTNNRFEANITLLMPDGNKILTLAVNGKEVARVQLRLNYCIGDALTNSPFAGGDGVADPFKICTAAQLNQIGHASNSSNLNLSYELRSDIDMNGIAFNTIGDFAANVATGAGAFQGSFTGNGYTISNLTIGGAGVSGVGMFGQLNVGLISDLVLANLQATGTNDVGGLIGRLYNGTVDSVVITGSINGSGNRVGAITGNGQGIIQDSIVSANVTGANLVGGFVGSSANSVTISRSKMSGTVTGSGATGIVGGFVGTMRLGTISESINSGSVVAVADLVGGFVGGFGPQQLSILNSYSTAPVTVTGAGAGTRIGGLVGNAGTSVAGVYSFSTNRVFVTGAVRVNGVPGYAIVGLAEQSDGTTDYSTWDPGNAAGCFRSIGAGDEAGGGNLVFNHSSYCPTVSDSDFLSSQLTFGASGYGWDESVWTLVNGQLPKLAWE